MELLQLEYFLKLAEKEHVTKVAEELNISQPSLSSTIKKLETELGVPLFERHGRNISLSPYGRVFRDYAEQAIIALENGKTVVSELHGEYGNILNLGVLSPYVWADLFSAFSKAHPEIRINRYSMEGNQFTEALLNKKIDMYIGGLNNSNNAKLSYQTLYRDTMSLMINKSHPLANQKSVDLRSCENESFINLERSTNLQQFIDRLFYLSNFTPKVVMECDYTLRDEMVDLNYGISVTTTLSATNCTLPNVTHVEIVYPPLKRQLGLAWNKLVSFNRAMTCFRDFSVDFYADYKPGDLRNINWKHTF